MSLSSGMLQKRSEAVYGSVNYEELMQSFEIRVGHSLGFWLPSGAVYGSVHYKGYQPLKSFEIRVGHSPGFGLPSVAILP